MIGSVSSNESFSYIIQPHNEVWALMSDIPDLAVSPDTGFGVTSSDRHLATVV